MNEEIANAMGASSPSNAASTIAMPEKRLGKKLRDIVPMVKRTPPL